MTKEDVKALRKLLNMNQTEFAAKLGLGSYTYISAIENGKRPVSRFIVLACKQLESNHLKTAKNIFRKSENFS